MNTIWFYRDSFASETSLFHLRGTMSVHSDRCLPLIVAGDLAHLALSDAHTGIIDPAILGNEEIHLELVTAQWVNAFCGMRRVCQFAEMPRASRVIENKLVI